MSLGAWTGWADDVWEGWAESASPDPVIVLEQSSGGWLMQPVRRKKKEEADPQELESVRTEADSPVVTPADAAPTHIVIKAPDFAYNPKQLAAIREEAANAYRAEQAELRKKKKRREEEILLLM